MTGFKNFILRGNLVEIAVAFVMGVAFAAVATSFTNVITATIARIIGQNPNFDSVEWFKEGDVAGTGIPVGAFLTAIIAFLIMAAALYFFVVTPYNKARERFFPAEPEGTPADIALLTEIRDALQSRGA